MRKEEILKFYQNYRLYLFPAIVALSSLILIIFVIYPQAVKLITNQQVEGEILSKSKLLETKAQALDSLDQADLEKKVNFALSFLPADKDFVSALGLLQDLTLKSGFSTTSISLGSGSSKNVNAQSYNLKLEILGPVTLLPILISNIENSSRLMRVSSLDISAKGASQAVTISLDIDVLYLSAPTDFGSIDSPLPSLSEKDDEIIAKLAKGDTAVFQPTTQLGSRGKANPFE